MTINPIPLDDFPRTGRPWNNITPFTYRDGLTYLEVLEALRAWVRDVLTAHLNEEMGEFTEELNQALNDFQVAVIESFNQKMEEFDVDVQAFKDAVNAEFAALRQSLESDIANQLTTVNDALAAWDETYATFTANIQALVDQWDVSYDTFTANIQALVDQWTTVQIENNDVITAEIVEDSDSLTSGALHAEFVAKDELKTDVDPAAEVLRIVDQSSGTASTIRIEDTVEHGAPTLNFVHHGGGAGQAYAINIGNAPGAKSGFVGHQYSDVSPFMQIDNTDISTSIFIRNTENQVMNPGGSGTGAFMQFMPFGQTQSLFFLDSLQWINHTSKDMLVRALNPSIYGFGVQVDTDKMALNVTKNGTGAGNAVVVTNKGTGVGLFVGQESVSGAGSALHVYGLGTGALLRAQTADGDVFRIHANGDTEQYKAGTAHIMVSPSGARYRVSVNNSGEIVTAAA